MATDPALKTSARAAWRPRRLLVTRSSMGFAHGRNIAERAAALGVDVVLLPGDRLRLDLPDPRRAYAAAKATMAVVVAPPSKRRLQPIAPSADWRVDLAEGCPAPLRLLLPCWIAEGPADHPRLREPGRDLGRPAGLSRAGDDHLAQSRPGVRGHDVRGVLLYRSTGDRADHRVVVRGGRLVRELGGAGTAPLHQQVRGRRPVARHRSRWPHADARVDQPRRVRPVRRRYVAGRSPVSGAAADGARRLSGGPDDRTDHRGQRAGVRPMAR